MAADYVVRKEIFLRAEPARVWRALTDPEQTKQYFFKCEVHSDWIVGHPIVFRRTILLFPFELKGEIKTIEEGRRLQYTLANRRSTSHSLVTDTLTAEEGGTRLTITDDVGAGAGAERRYQRSDKGWDRILAGLRELVESE